LHTGREGLISKEGSRPAVYVIPTNEELLIARDTVRCVSTSGAFTTVNQVAIMSNY